MKPDLIQAHEATTFTASTPRGRLHVRIGQTHPGLDELLGDVGAKGWAFITTWNPGSELFSAHENHARQKELEGALKEGGYTFYRGNGIPDADAWDAEESALVLGIPRGEAVRLGRAYGQGAIVCGRLGEAAELVWCDEVSEAVNILDVPEALPGDAEFFEVLFRGEDVRVERIISHGHTTPEGEWYDQSDDEWVVLLAGEATLEWADGTTTELGPGDAVFIAAHRRHRVAATSSEPPCVWLALHGKLG